MLDVQTKEEEPEVVSMDSGCSEESATERPASKPYLKFGVSAILGLDVRHHHHQSRDGSSLRSSPEESSKRDMKSEMFQHSASPAARENEAKTFHPVYLHSYFHPLIQQAHSAGKHFSGKSILFFNAPAISFIDKISRCASNQSFS